MTDSNASPDRSSQPPKIVLIITAIRAALAIMLAVALMLDPGKTRSMLLNFMGMFWLMTGLMSLRWGTRHQHQQRRARVAGVISVLAGLLALSRNLTRGLLDEALAIVILGGVLLLTGIIHVMEGIPNVHEGRRQRSRFSVLLGVFELVLGAVLLYTPLETGPVVYGLATLWALLSGLVLIGEVLYMLRLRRENEAGQQP